MEGDLLVDTFNVSDIRAGNTNGFVEGNWLCLDVVAPQEEHEVFIDPQLPSKDTTLRLKPLGVLSGKMPQSKNF
jgi:hypothetical protein